MATSKWHQSSDSDEDDDDLFREIELLNNNMSREDFLNKHTVALKPTATSHMICSCLDDEDNAGKNKIGGWVRWKGCEHVSHKKCLLDKLPSQVSSWTWIQCSECQWTYGRREGNQPTHGRMITEVLTSENLDGFEKFNTIEMSFNFERPGLVWGIRRAPGFPMRAYLPATGQGQALAKMLEEAFDRKILFTKSLDVNPKITLKTAKNAGPPTGYPDASYLHVLEQQLEYLGIENRAKCLKEQLKLRTNAKEFLAQGPVVHRMIQNKNSQQTAKNGQDNTDTDQDDGWTVQTRRRNQQKQEMEQEVESEEGDIDENAAPYEILEHKDLVVFQPNTTIPKQFHDVLERQSQNLISGIVVKLLLDERRCGFIKPVGSSGCKDNNLYFLIDHVKNITKTKKQLARGTRVQLVPDLKSENKKPRAFMVFLGQGTIEEAIQTSLAKSDDCAPGWHGRGVVAEIISMDDIDTDIVGTMNQGMGFYRLHNNFLVPIERLTRYSLPVIVGDKVEFKRAHSGSWRDISQARVVAYAPRSADDLVGYFTNFASFLEGYPESTSRTLTEILTNNLMWKFIGTTPPGADPDYLIGNLNFVTSVISKASANHKALLVQALANYLTSPLLQEATQILNVNDQQSPKPDALSRFRITIEEFCLSALQVDSSKAPQLLMLVASFLEKAVLAEEDRQFVDKIFKVLFQAMTGKDGDVSNLVAKDGLRHSMRIMPEQVELCGETFESDANLQPVVFGKAHESCSDYLDQYYHLMKTESFAPIQEVIKEYQEGNLKPQDHHFRCLYTHVSLVGVNTLWTGLSLSLKFQTPRKVDWKRSSQLMYGNLLALSMNQDFSDTIWLTILHRDLEILQKDSVVLVKICEGNAYSNAQIIDQLMKFGGMAVMLESPSFFLSNFPVLKSIRDMDLENYLLKDIIVHHDFETNDMPTYLKKALNPRNPDYSIILEQLGRTIDQLDPSQQEAFKLAINTRLSIIQGPPGTGKTHIGIKLASLILAAWTGGPILVLTYKNHALDEFLKHMIPICGLNNIIRVGGRSQDVELKTRNLNQVFKTRVRGMLGSQIGEKRREIEAMASKVKELAGKLNSMNQFHYRDIIRSLSQKQVYNFLMGNWVKMNQTGKAKFTTKTAVKQAIDIVSHHFGNLSGFVHNCVFRQANLEGVKGREIILKEIDNLKHFLFQCVIEWLPKKEKLKAMRDMFAEMTTHTYDDDIIQELCQADFDQASLKAKQNNLGEDGMMDVDDDMVAEQHALHENTDIYHDERPIKFDKDGRRLWPTLREQIFYWRRPVHSSFRDAQETTYQLSDFPTCMEVMPESVMKKQANLWQLSEAHRIRYIYSLLVRQIQPVEEEFNDLVEQMEQLQREKEALDVEEKAEVARSAEVIGVTITGASIHKQLLQRVAPRVVIVEEAAEVLEPSLLAALCPTTEHLILIGDHKQLRPQVETNELVRKFGFDISMMERLIESGHPFSTLTMQNRMRPEISLHLHDIYPDLQDNLARVSLNEPAKCLEHCLYWWSHDFPEDNPGKIAGGGGARERTKCNSKEADMAVSLAAFLIMMRACRPQDITLIGAYLGQKKLLQIKVNQMFSKEIADDIECTTIDSYQGDENKFVIVSLVRTVTLGYLAIQNRRCVAQSRAKCGLYYVGNLKVFTGIDNNVKNGVSPGDAENKVQPVKDNVWKRMIQNMKASGRVGHAIVAQCPDHPNLSKHRVQSSDELMKLVNHEVVLCQEICNVTKTCELHKCQLACSAPCHYHDFCNDKVKDKCQAGLHDLVRQCNQKMEDLNCEEIVMDTCVAGKHDIDRKCFQTSYDVDCKVKEVYKHPCGHEVNKKCHVDPINLRCPKTCGQQMNCGKTGHVCQEKCGKAHHHDHCTSKVIVPVPSCTNPTKHNMEKECSDISHMFKRCEELVKVTLQRQHCQHKMEKPCHQADEDVYCTAPCGKLNDCGLHKCKQSCGKAGDQNHSHSSCETMVQFKFPECGHFGEFMKKCSAEVIGMCKRVSYIDLPCGHNSRIMCYQEIGEVICQMPCERIRSCGHPCIENDRPCGVDCDIGDCKGCLLVEIENSRKAKKFAKINADKIMRKIHAEGEVFSILEVAKGSPEFSKVRDKVINYIQPSHNWYREVLKVEKITNYKLEKAFFEAKSEALGDYTDELFHGTGSAGIRGIPKTGFRLPPADANNMFGQGVYFAPNSSKSAQDLYTKGTNKLLLCNVIIGRALVLDSADPTMDADKIRNRGFDSVYAPRGSAVKNDEYVIYDPRMALPKYIISLSQVQDDNVRKLTETLARTLKVGETVTKRRVFPSRECKLDDPTDNHFRYAESHFLRMIQRHPDALRLKNAAIESIDFVYSQELNSKYESMAEAFKAAGIPTKEVLAYHGTAEANIDSILKTNLNRKERQAYGPGFYFSEFPAISLGYGSGLIMFRALPGNEYVGSDGDRHEGGGPTAEFQSKKVRADSDDSGEMLIIDNSEQFVPFCVLNIKRNYANTV